ncbi:MAG: hypothetical protein COA78_03805 [Blastopirellula sp.]|nr:MAG: hypothetical protein COA78_03805 [Blastopirellula sp.]
MTVPEVTAYHESGHALMAVVVGAQVDTLTIEPDYDDLPERSGDTKVRWELSRFTQRELYEKMILVALAGPVAEMIYSGDPFHPGQLPEWAEDWSEAWTQAAHLISNEAKRMAYLEQTTAQLHQLLSRDDYWAALAAISDELLAHETIEGEQVAEITAIWLAN